jgi:hypothetical protein
MSLQPLKTLVSLNLVFAAACGGPRVVGDTYGGERDGVPAGAAKIFVSTTAETVYDQGLSALDGLCRSDAISAGLTLNYVAMVEASSRTLASLLNDSRPAYALNGGATPELWIGSLSGILAGQSTNFTLQRFASGNLVNLGTTLPIIGRDLAGSLISNCNDWAGGSNVYTGSLSGNPISSGADISCGITTNWYKLICIGKN